MTVVYGDQADAIARLGENSAEAFGLTTTEVNEAAIAMGAFAEKIDESDPADAFTNVIERATDFASVMNIDTGQALDDFQSGLAGQSRPLKKYGLDISAATIEQTALAEGIIEIGEEMTEGQKVQARWRTIMKQTEKTTGDFRNTADGLANSQKILTAKWREAQVELGARLAPVMLKLGDAATDLIPVFGAIVDVIGDMVDDLGPLIDLLGDAASLIGDLSDSGVDATGPLGGFGDVLGRVNDLAGLASPLGLWRKGLELIIPASDDAAEASRDLALAWTENLDPAGFGAAERMGTLAEATGDGAEEMEGFGVEVDKTVKKIGKVILTLKDTREAMRRLADPVFNAERALDDFNETLVRVQEDAVVTQDEIEELTESYVDMQGATDALNANNIEAYDRQSREALERLDEGIEISKGNLDSLAEVADESFDRVIRRVGGLASQPLTIDVRLTAPSPAEIRRLMLNELGRLRREGVLSGGI